MRQPTTQITKRQLEFKILPSTKTNVETVCHSPVEL